MGKPRTAVVVTGSEVAKGRIEDAFGPAVEAKLKEYDVPVMSRQIVSDDMESIIRAIRKAADDGAEMILCTGGMSVDPDDRTPGAIKSLGAEIVTYGAPVLPGAMFLLAYYNADGDRGRHGGQQMSARQMEPQGEYRSWGFPAASCIPEGPFST